MKEHHPTARHFFISYHPEDTSWAQWIAAQLSDHGYSVFVQAWDFQPGQNLVLEMQRAASQAERTLALLSPSFLTSRFTAAEWAAAFAQDPTGERRKLIPVRVAPCLPEGLLGPIIYIDLVGKDEDTARTCLFYSLKHSGRPPQAARFPGASPSPTPATRDTAVPSNLTGRAAHDATADRPLLAPSRTSELRRMLQLHLRLDSDLDAFCLDFFPQVKRRFSTGMERTVKESLLLDLADLDDLAERLWHIK